jgi:hypothetical protein
MSDLMCVRRLTEIKTLQLRGDGVDTEKRVIPPGACAAEVACVPTSAR